MIDLNTCNYLLGLPKEVDGNIKKIELVTPTIKLKLIAPSDTTWTFLLQISKSLKGQYRISLHHQENNNYIGLARIDYNSGHRNPASINGNLPDILKKYAGKQINDSHIHFNVESYPPLSWAMPLADYKEFPVWDIAQNSDYTKAIQEFARMINLNINFTIVEPLI